jgi:hypothetical protein
MKIKASGRAALIVAVGLFACSAGSSQATAGADEATAVSGPEGAAGKPVALNKYAKHGSRHRKEYAHQKSGRVAPKSFTDQQATAAEDGDESIAIPPSVANANAKLASADSPAGNAMAMSARANDILQAPAGNLAAPQTASGAQVIGSDQLNEVDRTLHQGPPPAAPLAMASAEAPGASAAPVVASSNETSIWDQTSLIGKIFIALGGLLTLASAARMFMA